jgi:hypothetical protein
MYGWDASGLIVVALLMGVGLIISAVVWPRIQLPPSTSTGISLESLSLELASERSGLNDALDEISSTGVILHWHR